jgi:hypothetical protein
VHHWNYNACLQRGQLAAQCLARARREVIDIGGKILVSGVCAFGGCAAIFHYGLQAGGSHNQ